VTADPLRPLHRYVDRVDAGDLDAVGGLFTADAVYDVLGTERHGPEAIVRALRRSLSRWERTSHHATNPLVDVDGARARVSAGLYAYHGRGDEVWHFWGRYTQALVLRDDGWAIARMALIGIASDPPGDPALFPGHPDRRPVTAPEERRSP
jgi:ketosteroid isomerase-like protein